MLVIHEDADPDLIRSSKREFVSGPRMGPPLGCKTHAGVMEKLISPMDRIVMGEM